MQKEITIVTAFYNVGEPQEAMNNICLTSIFGQA